MKYLQWLRWANRLSIMVGPVCIVGLVFEWIMISWAVTRGRDRQRNICLSVYTSHYCSTLCACWWTGTSEPVEASLQKRAAGNSCQLGVKRRAWSVSPCPLWFHLTICSGWHSQINTGQTCCHEFRKLLASSSQMDALSYLLLSPHLLFPKTMSCTIFLLLLRSQLTHLENGCLWSGHNKHRQWCIN